MLVKFRDDSHSEDCTVFYRPSFGRSQYGEFDTIIITPKKAYLVESKWDGSGDLSKGLEEHQIRRHEILRWYHKKWKGEESEDWDVFARNQNQKFKEKFDGKYIPASPTILSQNLQTILKELEGREIEDVLLIFYKDEPADVEQEGFTTINIKYESTLGLYTKLGLSYNEVFLEALENVIEEYRKGRIRFYSEGDLQSHVFSKCLKIMEREEFKTPFKVYSERGVFSKRSKVDLVLGDDEVLVEFKLEPDYPGVSKPVVFSTIKEAGSSGSVELDLEKIDDYANKGKPAHFVMLDEDGKHARKINGEWKEMTVRGKNRFWLKVYRKPTIA